MSSDNSDGTLAKKKLDLGEVNKVIKSGNFDEIFRLVGSDVPKTDLEKKKKIEDVFDNAKNIIMTSANCDDFLSSVVSSALKTDPEKKKKIDDLNDCIKKIDEDLSETLRSDNFSFDSTFTLGFYLGNISAMIDKLKNLSKKILDRIAEQSSVLDNLKTVVKDAKTANQKATEEFEEEIDSLENQIFMVENLIREKEEKFAKGEIDISQN